MVKKSKSRILKISLIIIFCSVLIGLGIWRLGNLTFTKPPEVQNFIFLSVDDLRADRLGCYGNERDVSPNIDMLANQGAQFLNAFISWPMTFRSHGSMFTSVYPPVFDVPLDPNIQTIASILNNYGYKTTAFTGGGWMSAEFGILNGFEEYNDRIIGLRRLEYKTKKWLEENQEKKFFLFLHTYYIHRPFVAPEKYFEKFADPKYSGPIKNNGKSTAAFIKAANAGEIAVTPEDMQRMLDIYDSQIPRIDEFVSLIVETLKRLDLINKTMLIITSDHGEQLYEYKHFGHHSQVNPFADITTRVPLIIYCPILRHKGKVEKLAEVIDIPLTMLEAAGIEIPKTFQGQSFFPVLNGRSLKEKKEVFFCTLRFVGIRTEQLKLIVNLDSGEVKLYDLINDPTERENIVNKRSASEVESLIKEIEIFEKRNGDLRRKLGISQIKLAKGLPSKPFTFDSNSVFLATFNHNTFFFRKENSRHKANFSGREFPLMNGKHGNGLLLGADRKIEFPLKAPILSDSGAVEFWFKIDREESDKQELFRIDLDGEDSSIFIQATIFWNWGEKLKKRVSFEFARSQQESIQKVINFSTKFAWNTWHHISIAWEPDEVFILIDGVLASREKTYSGNFFKQKLTDKIKISGENCMLDELRISNVPRLYRPSQQRKKKLDSKVLERLKSLGYIK